MHENMLIISINITLFRLYLKMHTDYIYDALSASRTLQYSCAQHYEISIIKINDAYNMILCEYINA